VRWDPEKVIRVAQIVLLKGRHCLLLVSPFSNGQLCLEKVVTTSEPSGITVIACEVKA
jgi:hypothetical protein